MIDDKSQARPNRKERRKANVLAKKTRPLARFGVPIHTGTVRIVLDAPDGPQTKYYWWASETNPNNLSEQEAQELMAATVRNGPFDTKAEADEAARIAVIGPDCKITKGGKWDDSAWEKPQ
jgi:hypothetical protein